MENGMTDSNIVRDHPYAAGDKKEGEQGIGRSREGYTSQIHVLVDGLGNPLRVCLTPRQRHNSTQSLHLIGDFKFENPLQTKAMQDKRLFSI